MAVSRALPSVPTLSAGRRRLFLLGILLSLGAFAMTFMLGTLMVLRSQAAVGDVPVVVAARDIQAREPLTADALQVVSYPANLAPTGAISSVQAATGKFSVAAISKRQPLTSAMLSAQADASVPVNRAYLPIPVGFVALTIPTSEQEGVAGYIAPGDYIDVVTTVNTAVFGQNPGKTVTRTIFTNVHVIRVGPDAGVTREGAAGGVSSSLTVLATSCDAEMWSWLLTNATMRYELRSYKDYAPPAASTNNNGCAVGGTAGIGPAQVDARFQFTKI
jgi:pilus assembly protein CpaB